MTSILTRTERIKIHLFEYYFGYSIWIQVMRLIGGPIIFAYGIRLYQQPGRFGIAYGGMCLAFGLYYTLKPFLLILSRYNNFKTLKIEIEISENKILLTDDTAKSEVYFDSMRRILKRRFYYAFELANRNKFYLPFVLLNDQQLKIIEEKLAQK